MFSFPAGIPGAEGKGKTRGVMLSGNKERRGERRGRFLGVVTTVIVRRRVERSWWVRSKRGIMWPCAGYGITKIWVVV